jgi:hypothetical protein
MLHTTLLIAWLGCQSLDLGTTLVALHQDRYMEGNPLLRGKRGISIKIGVNVALFAYKDSRRSYTVPTVMAVSGCLAGGWNLHQLTP